MKIKIKNLINRYLRNRRLRNVPQRTLIAENKGHLLELIQSEIKLKGNNCDLNHIDVSKVMDMRDLFAKSNFNGDISKWDVRNVYTMENMFRSSQFSGDISKWNVFKVETMRAMFAYSKFKGDLSDWRPYKLVDTDYMFEYCKVPTPYWLEFSSRDREKLIDEHVARNRMEEFSASIPVLEHNKGPVKKRVKL